MKSDSSLSSVNELNALVSELLDHVRNKRRKPVLLLSELFETYMRLHAKVRCRSWQKMEKTFASYFSHWADRDASSITKHEVRAYHAELAIRISKTTANHALELLGPVYNFGIDQDLIEVNPVRRLKKFKIQSRERFLERDELVRLKAAIETLRYEVTQDFIWMCLFTGIRRSNVASMRWDDISMERGVWKIPLTKNGRSQNQPLTSQAMEILVKRRKNADDSPWVFPSFRSKTGHLTKPENAWEMVRLRAGIEDLRLHDLRRTLASWEALTGANLSTIAATLNHQDFKSTMIYARLNVDTVRDAMQTATEAMGFSSSELMLRRASRNQSIDNNNHRKTQPRQLYGYCFGRMEGGGVRVIPDELAIFERVKDLHESGASIGAIALLLNGEGKFKRGRHWHKSTVDHLLRSEEKIKEQLNKIVRATIRVQTVNEQGTETPDETSAAIT